MTVFIAGGGNSDKALPLGYLFFMSAITKFLPKRRMSRWLGHLMHWEGPSWLIQPAIRIFAKAYKINIDEAEHSCTAYPSVGEFFVRRLKAGSRPLASSWAVHPADSRITQSEVIDDGTLVQAKGITYKLFDFTQDPECTKKWAGGLFITYYLCPTDYHRVHSPVDGDITDVRYMPGQLWPVNEWSTSHVKDLFTVNERILVEIATELGPVGVMFVGATNVGHIRLSFDDSIRGNQMGPHIFHHQSYSPQIPVHKGSELGMFRMGSTVVMLYPPAFRQKYGEKLNLGPLVKVNSALTF